MVTHEAWLTKLFNAYLAGAGNALLALFGQKAANPSEPWADFIVMQILVAVIMIVMFAILRGSLSVDKPGTMQQSFELVHDFIGGEADDQVGHDAPSACGAVRNAVRFSSAGESDRDRSRIREPDAGDLCAGGMRADFFPLFQYRRASKSRVLGKYLKHFLGPIPALAPLMIPIEIISTLARPLSLSIRLFANMYAGEQVTLVFLGLTYLIGPAIFMGLHVFVGLLQAYIFVLLTMIYVAGAVAEAH